MCSIMMSICFVFPKTSYYHNSIYIYVKNVNVWVNYVEHLRKNLGARKNILKIVFLVWLNSGNLT